MSQGVARVDSTGRPVALHSAWVPIGGAGFGPDPIVQAPFYGSVFAADFQAKPEGTGVVEIAIGGMLSAYAAYEDGKLARVAVVNLKEWTTGDENPRGNATVVLQGVGNVARGTLRRLTAEAGAGALGFDRDKSGSQNITWAGEQWTYAVDNGNGHGGNVTESVSVTDGKLTIVVRDSEAATVSF